MNSPLSENTLKPPSNVTIVPSTLPELVAELLLTPIPYRTNPDVASMESFYLVCNYPFIPKGTVLFCRKPGESRVQIQGFLPQASMEERMALQSLLIEKTKGGRGLTRDSLEQSQLRPFTEEQGIQRLLELQQILQAHNLPINGTALH